MPRGPVVASPVPGAVPQNPGDVIQSSVWNATVNDIYNIFNTAQPIEYGGSNASTPIGAFDNFHTASTSIASATTTDLSTASGYYVEITGTTTITGLGTEAAGVLRALRFSGILTLTHNTTSLILPGAANITTAAGDTALFVSEGGGNWRCIGYARASGEPVTASQVSIGRNRAVNADMSMSQENGNTSGTTDGYFGADQWATYRVTSAGVITTQRVQSRTPAGATDRYRVTISTADASLAAGEYLKITQPLEGSNVKDFLYGTASAKASVLRFGFKGPAGTYAARLGNSATNRSFVALFTITAPQANTDTVQTIAITGDTTGTWLTADGVIGIALDIVLACGATFQGVTGWQAGNILGTSAVSNGMSTGAAVFELFDVGLKIDPDSTGVYGQYEVGPVDAVYRPERYYAKSYAPATTPGTATYVGIRFAGSYIAGAGTLAGEISFPQTLCKTPSAVSIWDGAGNSNRSSYVDQATGITFTDNDPLRTAAYAISTAAFSIKCSSGPANSYIHFATSARLS